MVDIVRLQGLYEIVAFLGHADGMQEDELFYDCPVLRGEGALEDLRGQGVSRLIVAIGDCQTRTRLGSLVKAHGFSLATAIHPRATVAETASIGPGGVVAAGAVVNPGCKIGESVIVNTCSSVDHDCVIESGVHVCPGCHLAGGVQVGESAFLGIGTSVKDHVRIGAFSVIGAGSVVIHDIPPHAQAYGVPAQIVSRS